MNSRRRERYRNDPEFRERANDYQRGRYQTNPEYRRQKLATRRRNLYGLSWEEYLLLLEGQDGVCAICHQPSDRELHVDHDHLTGRVRGLLCGRCNTGLGFYEKWFLPHQEEVERYARSQDRC